MSTYHVYFQSYCHYWLIFYIFCWLIQKISHSLGKILKWSSLALLQNAMVHWVLSYHCQVLKIQDSGIFLLCQEFSTFHELQLQSLFHFLEELNKIFQMHLNILSKLGLIFCCHQQKIQKIRLFNDNNFEKKHDN